MSAEIRAGDRVVKLQRVSWKFLRWVPAVGFSGAAVATAVKLSSDMSDPNLWAAPGAMLGTLAIMSRIASSHILLRKDSLIIVNPINSWEIPYRVIKVVGLSPGGTVAIMVSGGKEFQAASFGGSLLDRFFKTSERVVPEIQQHIAANKQKGVSRRPIAVSEAAKDAARTVKRTLVRRDWVADIALFLGIVLMLTGAMVNAFGN